MTNKLIANILMILIIGFILIIIAPTAFYVYYNRPAHLIIGEWREDNSTMTFYKDGTVYVEEPGLPVSGDYKILNDRDIKFDLKGIGTLLGPIIYKYEVDTKYLILTGSDGHKDVYKRTQNSSSITFLEGINVFPIIQRLGDVFLGR